MKMSPTYMRRFLFSISLLVLAMVCIQCQKDSLIEEKNGSSSVLVAMVIDNGDGLFPSFTRATGNIDEGNPVEGVDPGTEDERFIGSLRLLTFDELGILRFNKLFSRSALLPEDQFNINPSTGVITVRLRLEPGTYEFRAVTNEAAEWELATLIPGEATLDAYETKASQTVTNPIIDEAYLHEMVTQDNTGIPMLGGNRFEILSSIDSDETNPIVLSDIKLKRTLAKVEITLTNRDENNQVFPEASGYKIEEVKVARMNQNYILLEQSSVFPDETNGESSIAIDHVQGATFSEKVFSGYIAERKSVSSKSEATYAQIRVSSATTEVTYTISLDQLISGAKTYNIHRNTIYRINGVLKGNALTLSLNVLPWTKIETTKIFDDTGTPFGPTEKLQLTSSLPFDEANNCVIIDYDANNPLKGVVFTLKSGNTAGALWKATITDGLDFGFTTETGYLERGTTTASGGQQTKVIPRRAPLSGTLGTDVYFSINGVEQPIEVTFSNGVVKTFSDGSNERLNIQCVR